MPSPNLEQMKDPERQEIGKNHMKRTQKNLKEKFDHMVEMILEQFIYYFQQDLNDSVSLLISIEGRIPIIRIEHKT